MNKKQILITLLLTIGCAQSALAMESCNATFSTSRTGDMQQASLIDAILNGDEALCEALINQNIENVIEQTDDFGNTPLILAAKKGHLGICRLLVHAGAQLNCSNCKYKTPLFFAAKRGYFDVCQFLIEEGAIVHRVHKAAYEYVMKEYRAFGEEDEKYSLHRQLLWNEAIVPAAILKEWPYMAIYKFMNQTITAGNALCEAIELGDLVVATKILILTQTKVANYLNPKGFRPLHIATMQGNHAMYHMLCDAGANPSLADSNGKTPQDILICKLRAQAPSLLRDCCIALMRLPPKDRCAELQKLNPCIFEKITQEYPELVFDIEVNWEQDKVNNNINEHAQQQANNPTQDNQPENLIPNRLQQHAQTDSEENNNSECSHNCSIQ